MTVDIQSSQWLLLFFICLVLFCYAINRFGLIPIQDQIINYYEINSIDYNLAQSLYAWPNVATCIICGILCDKIGLNKMLFGSWIIIIIGSVIVTLSAQNACISYWMLCLGRTFVGIGNESISITIRVFAWNNFNPNQHGLILGIIVAGVSVGVSTSSIFIYQVYKLTNSIQFTVSLPLILNTVLPLPLFTYITLRRNIKTISSDTTNLIQKKDKSSFNISDIKSFPLIYWIFLIFYCCYEVSVVSFVNIAVSFYHHMYGYSYSLSSTFGSIPSFITIVLLPTCGYITDKYGKRCKWLICATIILIVVHFSFGWLHINIFITIITLLLFGVSRSILYPIIWSSIPILVNKKVKGTALGILTSLRFVALAIGYIIVGILTKDEHGDNKYINVQYFELSMAILSILLAVLLFKLDQYNGNKLDSISTSNETDIAMKMKIEGYNNHDCETQKNCK